MLLYICSIDMENKKIMNILTYSKDCQFLDSKNVTPPEIGKTLKLNKIIITSCEHLMKVLNDGNFYQDSKIYIFKGAIFKENLEEVNTLSQKFIFNIREAFEFLPTLYNEKDLTQFNFEMGDDWILKIVEDDGQKLWTPINLKKIFLQLQESFQRI